MSSRRCVYFAYGSNLLYARIAERLGPCRSLGLGWLDGFTLEFHKRGRDGSGKGDALRTAGLKDRLYGGLFELSFDQKRAMDGFEGTGYRCDACDAWTNGGRVAAHVYVAKSHVIDAELRPFGWYRDLVLEGAREVGAPAHYVQAIARVAIIADPDDVRARHHEDLLGRRPSHDT